MKKVFQGNTNIFGKKVILLFALTLVFIDLFFLIFYFSNFLILVVSMHLFIIGVIIFLMSRIYDIKIENKIINVKNIWAYETYPLSQLKDVRLVRFIFFYPLNPYLKFTLKNKKEFITVLPNRLKIYLTKGGVNSYIESIKNDFIQDKSNFS